MSYAARQKVPGRGTPPADNRDWRGALPASNCRLEGRQQIAPLQVPRLTGGLKSRGMRTSACNCRRFACISGCGFCYAGGHAAPRGARADHLPGRPGARRRPDLYRRAALRHRSVGQCAAHDADARLGYRSGAAGGQGVLQCVRAVAVRRLGVPAARRGRGCVHRLRSCSLDCNPHVEAARLGEQLTVPSSRFRVPGSCYGFASRFEVRGS